MGWRSEALTGDIEVPGDKSISHRALILGGLASGETRISGLLEGEDVLHTADAVRAFGADVERVAPGEWRVRGAEWRSRLLHLDDDGKKSQWMGLHQRPQGGIDLR